MHLTVASADPGFEQVVWAVAAKTAELKVTAAETSVTEAEADYQTYVATVGLFDQGSGIELDFAAGPGPGSGSGSGPGPGSGS